MISAISSLNAIRSTALHACVIEILMFPAIEYPTAMTWKYSGICFWLSMLLMWFLASIPLGLSVGGVGGLTWMIRHWGLAIFFPGGWVSALWELGVWVVLVFSGGCWLPLGPMMSVLASGLFS